MAATLELIFKAQDGISPVTGKMSASLGNLAKAGAGAALGFTSMEAGIGLAKSTIISSIGSAAAYEGQLAKLRALTGATKKDTDFLSDSIKGMSSELAKSPAELAAGAYFILSSGITDAADAAEVLEIAAKASAIGMGETEVVADALTTVLNAYGKEASEAGQVTDVLMQAVKDGKAEASEFAGVLGRVVPIAAQMGISFEEVAANMATFTRLGVDADEAATGLRGAMTALLNPSAEAEAVLHGVGLSMAQVRAEVREKGLAAVLQGLTQKFKGNEEALGKLFPEVRGLTNVLATAGSQGETYLDILGNMEGATGNLDKGFAEVSDTTQFKLNKAMNELNLALMELGAEVLPIVAKAAEIVAESTSKIDTAFTQADKSSGGYVKSVKDILNPQEALNKELERGEKWVGAVSTGFGLFGGKAEAALPKIDALSLGSRTAAERFGDLRGALEDTGQVAGRGFKDGVLEATDTVETLTEKADLARDALFKMFTEPTKEEVAAEAVLASYELQLSSLTDQMTPLTDAQNTWLDSLSLSGQEAEIAELKARGLTDAEAAQYLVLKDNLIPEQRDHLDLLDRSRDAAGKQAEAMYGTFPTWDELKGKTDAQILALLGLEEQIGVLQQPIRDQAQLFADQSLKVLDATGKVSDYAAALGRIPTHVNTSLSIQYANDSLPVIGPGGGAVPFPGHAKGLWRVPGAGTADSYPAMLAPGEMVLPRAVADGVRAGASGGGPAGGGMSIDYDRLASALVGALTGMSIDMDGEPVARMMERRLGRTADLYGRAG